MSRKTSNILILVVLVLAGAVAVWMLSNRHYKWDSSQMPSESVGEPFGLDLVDEYLERTLDNGYSVKVIDPVLYSERTDWSIGDGLDNENIFVVYNYSWAYVIDVDLCPDADEVPVAEMESASEIDRTAADCDYISTPPGYIRVFDELCRYAYAGGKAVLVIEDTDIDYHGHYGIWGVRSGSLDIESVNGKWVNDYSRWNLTDTQDSIFELHDVNGNRIPINHRFARRRFVENAARCNGLMSMPNNMTAYNVDAVLWSESVMPQYYAIRLSWPRSGGCLYVTTLFAYFTNLGLELDNGDRVIASLFEEIDDRPVVRLQYPRQDISNESYSGGGRSVLDRVKRNPALWCAWILALIGGLCLLSRGLMRREPVRYDPTDTDPTDTVSVREARMRRSPRLHFLYQTSWLYRGAYYRSLLMVNYRRLCRVLNRTCGVELQTASYQEVETAAKSLAGRLGLRDKDVLAELLWMRDIASDPYRQVTAGMYSESQQIVERLSNNQY